MKAVASRALEVGMERLARQLPSSGWLMTRWPSGRTPGPVLPASSPR